MHFVFERFLQQRQILYIIQPNHNSSAHGNQSQRAARCFILSGDNRRSEI